jgi:ubiquinone/menaquinone biosynthesis C-methylase UbiE
MILDVGCGYHPKGDVNIDLHPEPSVHRGSMCALDVKQIPNFVKADVCHLPFRPHSFSRILMYEVLEHLPNPTQALTNIKGALESTGVFEFSIPNMMYWRAILRWIAKEKITISARKHINGWRLPEVRNLLEINGFEIINVGYADVIGDMPSLLANVLPRITKHSMVIDAKHRMRAR